MRPISDPAASQAQLGVVGAVRSLEALGVRFDCDHDGRLAMGLEGGHSARRVVHAGGAATGRRLVARLSALVAEDQAITVLENRRVAALLSSGGRCHGVRLDDGHTVWSGATALATGGATRPGAAGRRCGGTRDSSATPRVCGSCSTTPIP